MSLSVLIADVKVLGVLRASELLLTLTVKKKTHLNAIFQKSDLIYLQITVLIVKLKIFSQNISPIASQINLSGHSYLITYVWACLSKTPEKMDF